MSAVIRRACDAGVEAIAFGDLFLQDIRAYRERQLAGTGVMPLFPLWGRDTTELAAAMIDGGLRARITCVDPRALDARFAGREFDRAFLDEIPGSCDPCGERGEFHTFAYAGPMFDAPIAVCGGDGATATRAVAHGVAAGGRAADRGAVPIGYRVAVGR